MIVGVSECDHGASILRSHGPLGTVAKRKIVEYFSLFDRTFREFAHYVEEQPGLRPVLTRTQFSHPQPHIGAAICYDISGNQKTVAYLCH